MDGLIAFFDDTRYQLERHGQSSRQHRTTKLPDDAMQEPWHDLLPARIRNLDMPRLRKWLGEGAQPPEATGPMLRYARARRHEVTRVMEAVRATASPGKPWEQAFFRQDVAFARDVILDLGVHALRSPTVCKVLRALEGIVDNDNLGRPVRTAAFRLMQELLTRASREIAVEGHA